MIFHMILLAFVFTNRWFLYFRQYQLIVCRKCNQIKNFNVNIKLIFNKLKINCKPRSHSYENIIENYGNINNIFEIIIISNSDFYFSIFTLVHWQTEYIVQTIFDGKANSYSPVQYMTQTAIGKLSTSHITLVLLRGRI